MYILLAKPYILKLKGENKLAGYKPRRLSEDIRRIISEKIRDLKDPRINNSGMITIVRCDVSNDISYCKVYVSSFEGFDKAKEAVKGFESASGLLKREISNVLRLRKCPELEFVADNSMEHSIKINKILKDVSRDKSDLDSDNETL